MTDTRTCAECGAALPGGVTDVFCPACALRRALVVKNVEVAENLLPRESNAVSSFGWIGRFKTVNRLLRGRQKGLASSADVAGQFPRLTTAAPEPGDVIEDYEILDKIGGNMGLVFKARHRLLDNIVALKFFPADYITDPARLARFERELRAMGQLKHPNLVTAADARVVGCWHLVAMELIEGMDLQRLVQLQGPLPVAPACEMARQAALGLQYAHEHGLIHRDIKPSNLMLTAGGTIKVIDMGLALSKGETQLTQAGSMLGTMSYCAPEQVRDASQVDIRADIYALGCTLYHLLAGKPPYAQRKTFPEVLKAHLHEPFPSLTAARPDAPEALEAVLARMTAKEPDARFSTPQEVAEALEPFARGADLKPLAPARIDQGPPVRPAAGRTPPTPVGRRGATVSEPLQKRWPLVAALLVLLLVIGGVAFLVTSLAKHDPVVVLMDTTAPRGVYDADNRAIGASNAKELVEALRPDLPVHSLNPVSISAGWAGEMSVITLRPDLVIIHRSSFFHSYNAVFDLGSSNVFKRSADDPKWVFLYNNIGDDKLLSVLNTIATEVPQTKFLIYSRGTDTNWLSDDFRLEWVKKAEARFPKLKGRITTIVIPNGYDGSFRDPYTRTLLRSNVTHILKHPKKAK
jgi:serine/threonine protein kinase